MHWGSQYIVLLFGKLGKKLVGKMNQILHCEWGQDGAGKFSFYIFMDLDFVSVHKNAKRELGQYPVILTLCLVNNIHL